MTPETALRDKVVLVTGAAGGLGLAIVDSLLERGAYVAMTDIDSDALATAAQRLPSSRVLALKCNATQATEVQASVQRTVEHYGKLDMAVNNAGGTKDFVQIADEPEEAYDYIFNLNTRSAFLGMKYQILQMMRQGCGGSIVNLSSVCSVQNFFRGEGLYVGAKHAVSGLTMAAAFEYADQNIRVNAVAPGPCETPNKEGASPERERLLTAVLPMRRLGQSAEIAKAVCWLLSDESSFVTGHTLRVDGGYLARGATNDWVPRTA